MKPLEEIKLSYYNERTKGMGESEKKKLKINDEKYPVKENVSSGGGTKRNYKDTGLLDILQRR